MGWVALLAVIAVAVSVTGERDEAFLVSVVEPEDLAEIFAVQRELDLLCLFFHHLELIALKIVRKKKNTLLVAGKFPPSLKFDPQGLPSPGPSPVNFAPA
jgi:hypothetical protein